MKIAFIGFGEAARAFKQSLGSVASDLRFSAYDVLLDSEDSDGGCARAMRQYRVEIARSAADAVRNADWIFSMVTADQSLEAVKSVALHVRARQTLFDVNSVSPGRKREGADLLTSTGVDYIDIAVMAPVRLKGHRTPVLVAGSLDVLLVERMKALDFDFQAVGSEPGAATAIKMVRSLFVKGLEAITAETLLAASATGCLDYVLKSLGDSYPGLGMPEFAHYQFERMLKHGKRRAAEMRESAITLDDLGLHGPLAGAIADVQEKMGVLRGESVQEASLAAMANELLTLRRVASAA